MCTDTCTESTIKYVLSIIVCRTRFSPIITVVKELVHWDISAIDNPISITVFCDVVLVTTVNKHVIGVTVRKTVVVNIAKITITERDHNLDRVRINDPVSSTNLETKSSLTSVAAPNHPIARARLIQR